MNLLFSITPPLSLRVEDEMAEVDLRSPHQIRISEAMRRWWWRRRQRAKECPACSGSGLGPVQKIIEDRGDRLYTVYEACKMCDGTGERNAIRKMGESCPLVPPDRSG